MKFSPEEIEDIRQQMSGLSGKAARTMAKELAKLHHCDESRIYHYTREVRPERKQRTDKGDLRSIKDDELLKDMLTLTYKTDMNAQTIRDLVEHNAGVKISPATYNRYLREVRLSRRENKQNLDPYRSWEAAAPNQLHQIDTTVSQQFYLDDDGSFGYDKYYYKNKDVGKKPRLHLFQLVDDHSRVKFAMFVLNNTTQSWLNALFHAWRRKDDLGWPFFGIPEAIYTDNDSVVKSTLFKRTMRILGRGIGLENGVEIKTHTVGNSQAKGKVEGGFKLLQEFEKITLIEKFKSLDDANAALWDFLYGYNSRRHSTTGQAPFSRWLKVNNERLYDMPEEELYAKLQFKFDQRQLRKDLTISMFGESWQLPAKQPFINYVLKNIDIAYSPYDRDEIYVMIENKDYPIQHVSKAVHAAGDYKAMPKTRLQKLKEEIEEREYPAWEYSGFHRKMHGKTYLPKSGQEFDAASISGELPNAVTMRGRLWFMTQLQAEYLIETPPLPEETEFVNSVFSRADENGNLPENELIDIITGIRNGELFVRRRQSGFGVA